MKIKIIKKFLEKLPLAIAEHAFLACFPFFFLALIFGGFLFYKYNILVQKAEFEVFEKPFLLKEKTYQEILEVWQKDEKRFKEADFKEYSNPFVKSLPAPEEELTP